MKYTVYIWKRKVENVLLFPFILIGKLVSLWQPLGREYRIFFFFPFYHTGGAEKVHAQITAASGGKDCVIFFTRKSQSDTFLAQFAASGSRIIDISKYTDNRLLYFFNFIYRGILAGYINRQRQVPIIFNGQSNFAYKLSPWLHKKVRQTDLLHSFSNFSYIRIPFIPFYSQTVLISMVKLQEHFDLYERLGVPKYFAVRMLHINNAVAIPEPMPTKPETPFTLLFCGRPGPEKRPELYLRICAAAIAVFPDVRCLFLGADAAQVNGPGKDQVGFLGNIKNAETISKVYQQTHVLIVSSLTEGLPLAALEAMGHGCAVVATPVGDLPLHIYNGENGYLFSTVDDEGQIIKEAVQYVATLYRSRALLHTIGKTNYEYVQRHFSLQRFNEAYRTLLQISKAAM